MAVSKHFTLKKGQSHTYGDCDDFHFTEDIGTETEKMDLEVTQDAFVVKKEHIGPWCFFFFLTFLTDFLLSFLL